MDSPHPHTFGKSLSLRIDGGVGAVSISPTGRDVVLASKQGLYVVDLDDPFSPPRWLRHLTSWEVADVQWSPHVSKPGWVVSTSNQKAMVWNLARSSSDAIEHVLHGHSRAITDINFHPESPEILATCSVDTSVLAWDTRSPQKPYYKTCDWRAGASQVKWNFKNPNILASSHDDYFYIWDLRKGCEPLHTIQAHDRKINGLDFSRFKETEIVSCSNDGTVKFWDYNKSVDTPQRVITTGFPVWRSRYTPFGDGCTIMPMYGGDNSVYLVKDFQPGTSELRAAHVYRGHTDRVMDFLWRVRPEQDEKKFQLVTFSKDCDLRLWPVSEKNTVPRDPMEDSPQYVTYRKEPVQAETAIQRDKFVTKSGTSDTDSNMSHLAWLSGVRMGRSAFAPVLSDPNSSNFGNDTTPDNLGEEVSVVGHKFSKVVFEKISVSTGQLVVTLNGPWGQEDDDLIFLRIEIKFPKEYPTAAPKFKLEENRDLTEQQRHDMVSYLNDIGKAYTSKGRYCLEQCLRYLLGEKVSLDIVGEEDFEVPEVMVGDLSSLSSSSSLSSLSSVDNDSVVTRKQIGFDSTPIPKGCGAMWTPSGQLVCFFVSNKKPTKSLQLVHIESIVNDIDDDIVDSDDSFAEDWDDIIRNDVTLRANHSALNMRSSSLMQSSGINTGPPSSVGTKKVKNVVDIHDFSHLIPDKKQLALEYKLIGDTPEKLCLHNASVAEKHGLDDIAECWKIVSDVLITKDQVFYWDNHPLGGKWFLKELILYYMYSGHIQMCGMLATILADKFPVADNCNTSIASNLQEGIVHYEQGAASPGSYISDDYFRQPSRSSSVLYGEGQALPEVKVELFDDECHETATLLHPADEPLYVAIRATYAELLYSWDLPIDRVTVLKYNYAPETKTESGGSVAWVSSHHQCTYCGLKVQKRVFVCGNCQHVLHAKCASEWWATDNECPTGCGCRCIELYGVSN